MDITQFWALFVFRTYAVETFNNERNDGDTLYRKAAGHPRRCPQNEGFIMTKGDRSLRGKEIIR